MPMITDDELKALRVANPRGVVVLNATPTDDEDVATGEPEQFAFKKIDRAAYAKYRASVRIALASGGGTGEEEQQLARDLVVWPGREAFDALRDRAPSVAHTFGVLLAEDASASLTVTRDPR
jgi:hypothetical protein